ncbi:MAG: hypothetical protein ACYTEO_19605 [Planctomycetota bacterium]|jgi:hypothetical protein
MANNSEPVTILTECDSIDACKRGMQLLRERGLNHEVEDRNDPDSINEVFAIYDLPFDIRPAGIDWYEVVRFNS